MKKQGVRRFIQMSYARLYRMMESWEAAQERIEARAKLAETGSYFWACDVRSPQLWNAYIREGKVINGRLNGTRFSEWREGHKRERWRQHDRSARPFCGAKCRSGEPCKARVCFRPDGILAKRCRMHGGLSTGPKKPRTKFTPENRAAYFAALLECGLCVEAARRVGLPYKTICRWCEKDAQFSEACGVAYRLHYMRKSDFEDYPYSDRVKLALRARALGVI